MGEIADILSVSERTVSRWLSRRMKDMKAERDRQIAELWLACYTEEEIAEKVGVDQATVNRTMEEPCKADTWQKCMIFSAYSDPSWQPPLSQMSGSDTSSVAFGAPTPAWGRLSRRRDNLSWGLQHKKSPQE